MYQRIVTHDDFDGVVSAALAGYFLEIDSLVFAGPGDLADARVPTGSADVVCDLPYPLQCGMWFDHHEANFEDLALRGIADDGIPGLRAAAPSCARVIVEYFEREFEIDSELEEIAQAADRIDSFAYTSIEDWRAARPENDLDAAIKLKEGPPAGRRSFLRGLVQGFMNQSLEAVAKSPEVISRAGQFRAEEEQMLKLIEQHLDYLDPEKTIIRLDFSGHTRRVKVLKNLAQLLDPAALAVCEVNSLFDRGQKTNDLSFSMSLTIAGGQGKLKRDLGEIMRQLNIGSGHAGAASGTVRSGSKDQMLKNRERTLGLILERWRAQAEEKIPGSRENPIEK